MNSPPVSILALAAALVTAVMLPSVAQEKATGKPSAVVADLVVVTATVEAIDYPKRTVTLKGPEGRSKALKVDQTVKNFDQVQKGDQVAVEY